MFVNVLCEKLENRHREGAVRNELRLLTSTFYTVYLLLYQFLLSYSV